MNLSKIYKPTDILHIMIIKNFIWGMLGIILGIIINDIVVYVSNKLKIYNYKILYILYYVHIF